VVHVQRRADHLGSDHRAPRPGADDLAAARLREPLHLLRERRLDVGSLLDGARHYFCPRRRTMKTSVRRLLRVLWPLVGWPHWLTGWRPPEVRPSPPPWGWSTGFIATPRTFGRMPSQRERPALPIATFSCSVLPTWPIVAMPAA